LSDQKLSLSDLDALPELQVDTKSSSESDTDIALSDVPKSQYEKRFVGFVDLLGFEQIVLKTSAEAYRHTQSPEDRNKLLGQIVEALSIPKADYAEECFSLLEEKYDPINPLIKSRTFSDCVMFSAEYSELGLCVLLHSIFWVSRHMMRQGFYCRGAITSGEIFWDGKNVNHPIVFGPALNKAISLERNNAGISRVILCNSSAKKFDEYRKQSKQSKIIKLLNAHVSQAKDGPWQINFFADFVDLDGSKWADKKIELGVLADKLIMVMVEYTESPHVYLKLRAIAEHINTAARHIGAMDILIPLPEK
jgi:hypothetical protein